MIVKTHLIQHKKGFTLLEMLISVAVFALMAAIAYGGLSQVIRSSDQITESNKTLAELQFVISAIERDLLQLSPRKVRDEYGDVQDALKITNDKLIISRTGWNNFIGAQRSHIQRVEYVLDEEQLIRRYWLSLDQTVEQKPIQSVLMSNIKNVSFHAIDSAEEIHLTWPKDISNSNSVVFAKAIEIILEINQWGEVKKIIELVDKVE